MSDGDELTKYLNADLELVCAIDLNPLCLDLHSFGLRGIACKGGDGMYYLNCHGISGSSACDNISHIIQALSGLRELSREILGRCVSRVINVGYETGCSKMSFRDVIPLETIELLCKNNLSLHLTIYGGKDCPPGARRENSAHGP